MRIIIIVRVLGWDYILKLSKYYLWKILLSLRCTHYFADIHHFTNRMMLLSPDKSATLFRSANTCHQVSFSKTFHVGNLELYILTSPLINIFLGMVQYDIVDFSLLPSALVVRQFV